MSQVVAARPICDTPGCANVIPVGGEGHPEICPVCLDHMDKVDALAAKANAIQEDLNEALTLLSAFVQPLVADSFFRRARFLLRKRRVRKTKAARSRKPGGEP